VPQPARSAKLDVVTGERNARVADGALMASIASGDDLAFEEAWRLHYSRVFRLAYGVLLERNDAREVCQEVFVALLEVAPRWRTDALLTTWLHRVTMTRSFAWRRRVLRFRRPWSRSRTPTPAPDDALQARQTDERLRGALATLSPRERAVLTLHWEGDLGPAEIAALLHIQPTAARVALHRARTRIKAVLDPRGGAP